MRNKGLNTQELKITVEQLRWTLGNLRQPSCLITALGAGQLAGAVLTLTAEDSTSITATMRTKAAWERARLEWQSKNREKRQQNSQQASNHAKQLTQ